MDVLVKRIVQKTYGNVCEAHLEELSNKVEKFLENKLQPIDSSQNPKMYTDHSNVFVALGNYRDKEMYMDLTIAGKSERVERTQHILDFFTKGFHIIWSCKTGTNIRELENNSYYANGNLLKDYNGPLQNFLDY